MLLYSQVTENRILPDGSYDFGNGVIGPSLRQRIESNSSTSSPLPNFTGRRSLSAEQIAALGGVALITAACQQQAAVEGEALDTGVVEQGNSSTSFELTLPWPEGETRWLTGGPHTFTMGSGVSTQEIKPELDFAPAEVRNCNNPNLTLENYRINASASGKVTNVGKGIIDIDHENGYSSRYVHVGDVQVTEGDKVNRGDDIAALSCITPDGGSTTGVHLDFSVRRDGVFIPASEIPFEGGWRAFNDGNDRNYFGGMSRGDEYRIAYTGRCGPGKKSIQACDGIRNDVVNERTQSPNLIDTILAIEADDSYEEIGRKMAISRWLTALSSKQTAAVNNDFSISLDVSIVNIKEWEPNIARLLNGEAINGDPLKVNFLVKVEGSYSKYIGRLEVDNIRISTEDLSYKIDDIDRKNGKEAWIVTEIHTYERFQALDFFYGEKLGYSDKEIEKVSKKSFNDTTLPDNLPPMSEWTENNLMYDPGIEDGGWTIGNSRHFYDNGGEPALIGQWYEENYDEIDIASLKFVDEPCHTKWHVEGGGEEYEGCFSIPIEISDN